MTNKNKKDTTEEVIDLPQVEKPFWNDEIIKKIVVFPNDDGGVSILRPSPRFEGTINELAQKDVPTGKPYNILDAEDVPTDRTYREAWTADFNKPDGRGA